KGAPKYLNSPETPLYHKGEVLYDEESFTNAADERRGEILRGVGVLVDVPRACARPHPHGRRVVRRTTPAALAISCQLH
ncbi:MAG: hypothetical protein P8Y07_13425, partial [Gemmatimonadales bacterium]